MKYGSGWVGWERTRCITRMRESCEDTNRTMNRNFFANIKIAKACNYKSTQIRFYCNILTVTGYSISTCAYKSIEGKCILCTSMSCLWTL